MVLDFLLALEAVSFLFPSSMVSLPPNVTDIARPTFIFDAPFMNGSAGRSHLARWTCRFRGGTAMGTRHGNLFSLKGLVTVSDWPQYMIYLVM